MIEEDKEIINLGLKIKKLRTEKGFTQRELADIAEISKNYLGKIERGEANVTMQTIITIVKSLGVSLADIVN